MSIYEAHPITFIIVIGTIMITPFYIYALYEYSGASRKTGTTLAIVVAIWGAIASWMCLADFAGKLGLPGSLLIPVSWFLPTILLFCYRKTIFATPLSMKGIIGLQVFRILGGVFLIEMLRGNIPGVFAHPAGWGDILAGVVALVVLIKYWKAPTIPMKAVWLVFIIGILDFMSAFFFGFTSSASPAQLFAHDFTNRLNDFPTGMIPLFLVPYAIAFHFLSIWNPKKRL